MSARKAKKEAVPAPKNDNFYLDREAVLSLGNELVRLAGCVYGTRVERPTLDNLDRKILLRFVIWPQTLQRPIGEENVPVDPEVALMADFKKRK